MSNNILKRSLAMLLLLAAGHSNGQQSKPLPELPSLGSDPVQAPATQIKPYGAPAPKPPADQRAASFEQMQQARESFEAFVRAYETGDVLLIQRRLDPAMVGYQQFLDGVRSDVNALRQIRMQLLDTQIAAGPDVAVIQTAWEKRALNAATFQPLLLSGRSQILMHRGNDGWRLAAITGDNLFASNAGTVAASNAGTVAQLNVAPATFGAGNLPLDAIVNVPVQVQVIDPDLAGRPSVTVQVRSSQGDVETVTLPATGPGTFGVTTLRVRRNGKTPIGPGNGVIEFTLVPTTLTITFVDPLPATTLIRTVSGL